MVRGQGPRANGMPELHKLTPALSALQAKGHKVALVTDGRMSGASGSVPAAIVSTLTSAIDKAGASPQFTAAMANIGLEPSYQSAADFTKFWDEDSRRAEETIRQIGKVG